MTCLWWIGQAGILLEIVGAGYIVFGALKNKDKVAKVGTTWESLEHLPEIGLAIQRLATTEFRGFLVFATGLVLQLVGGFDGMWDGCLPEFSN